MMCVLEHADLQKGGCSVFVKLESNASFGVEHEAICGVGVHPSEVTRVQELLHAGRIGPQDFPNDRQATIVLLWVLNRVSVR